MAVLGTGSATTSAQPSDLDEGRAAFVFPDGCSRADLHAFGKQHGHHRLFAGDDG